MGLAGTNAWLAEWAGAFEDWSLDIEEIFDAGEMRFAQVWTFRDGIMARMEMYSDPPEALKAAGLRE